MDIQIPLETFERLRFRINGFNYSVPSNRMLKEIMSSMPDLASKTRFQEWNNESIFGIKQCFESESMQSTLSIVKTLCVLIGYDYNSLLRHWSITLYCDSLLGGVASESRQLYNQSLVLRDKLPEFVETGDIQFRGQDWPIKWVDGIPALPEKYKILCNRFTEYQLANTQFSSFWATVIQCRNEPLIQGLLSELTVENAKGTLGLRTKGTGQIEGKLRPVQCEFCGIYFEYIRKRGQGKAPPHCGSEQCRKAYGRLKPSKQKPSLTLQGWIGQGKKRRCIQCRKQRILNGDRVCEHCSKTLSE